ncbi:MAG: hypothetical protein NWP87_04565, partial [Winogradskyella sp.]|nr:hypothetical protein [Winogradskyella sp.]
YPKNGGSQFIIDRLAEGIDISCNEAVVSMTYENAIWTINNNWKAKHVVFTGDVRKLIDILDADFAEVKHVLKHIENLPSHGTSNLLCECDKTDLSWLYIPEEEFKTHRIIYTGNFATSNNKESQTDRISCTVEFSGEQDWETMTAEIKKLPGNLVPLDFNNEQNSYVIHNKDTKPTILKLKTLLKDYNCTLLGRFAEWEYYNMDKAIEKALYNFL